jgi:hypothetical protein
MLQDGQKKKNAKLEGEITIIKIPKLKIFKNI